MLSHAFKICGVSIALLWLDLNYQLADAACLTPGLARAAVLTFIELSMTLLDSLAIAGSAARQPLLVCLQIINVCCSTRYNLFHTILSLFPLRPSDIFTCH